MTFKELVLQYLHLHKQLVESKKHCGCKSTCGEISLSQCYFPLKLSDTFSGEVTGFKWKITFGGYCFGYSREAEIFGETEEEVVKKAQTMIFDPEEQKDDYQTYCV